MIGYSDVTVRHNVVHDFGGPGRRIETIPLFFRVSGDGIHENWNIENNLIYDMYAQDADNTYNSADCHGIIIGQDPMFDPGWHLPIGSPAQIGNPDFLDSDDPNPDTRS